MARVGPREEVVPSIRLKYRADIDGLRAVAILAVVGFHAFPNWIKGGFIGVDIFFVISGFLISTIIFESLDDKRFSFREFYGRRIKRIFPAFIVVLIAGFSLGWLVLLADELRLLGKHMAAGVGFVSNIVLWRESGYFDIHADLKPLLHLWSLGIEEQFYIIWPLLLWMVYRSKIRTFGVLLTIGMTSFLLNVAFIHHDPAGAFYLPLTRFWELVIGSTLAYLMLFKRDALRTGSPGGGSFQSVLGVALIGIGLVSLTRASSFPGWWALFPTVGTALVIAAGSEAWVNRCVLSNRALVWFGLVSFPLYLWHWPLLSFARIWEMQVPSPEKRILAVLLAISLAWLTYKFVEKPIRFGTVRSHVLITLSLFMGLIGFVGYASYKLNGFPDREIFIAKGGNRINANNIVNAHVTRDILQACPITEEVSPEFRRYCIVHMNSGSRPRVLLWGDSHAMAWSPLFKTIAKQNKKELYVVAESGCPPIVGIRRTDVGSTGSCTNVATNQTILDSIIKLKPDLVVLAARWSLYAHGYLKDGVLNAETHLLTTDPAAFATENSSRSALDEMIPKTLTQFNAHKIPVIVLKNPPILKSDINNKRRSLAEIQPTLSEHTRFSGFTDRIFNSIHEVVLFDPAVKMCDEAETCHAAMNGAPLYEDDNHLSVDGALYFEPEILELIEQNLNQRNDSQSGI